MNRAEAAQVRHVMRRYLELGSVRVLTEQLAAEGYSRKRRPPRDGVNRGGGPFTRGGIYHLLGNCVYIGTVRHKGEIFPGAHDAIVDRELWDRVQQALADQAPVRQRRANFRHPSLLNGVILQDGHGRRMAPVHTINHAKRYRYYATREIETGGPAAWRVPAHDLEELIIARVCRHLVEVPVNEHQSLGDSEDEEVCAAFRARALADAPKLQQAELLATFIERIDIHRDRLELFLRRQSDGQAPVVLTTSATLIRSGRQTRLVPPGPQTGERSTPDESLVRLVANAHAARLAVAAAGDRPLREVAAGQGFSLHYFSQLARLGGLAPDIVTAVLEGRQPAALTRTWLARTKALPLDWNVQRRVFGFAD
ncbi:MAG: recombinase family protein [Sphingomonas sp.]